MQDEIEERTVPVENRYVVRIGKVKPFISLKVLRTELIKSQTQGQQHASSKNSPFSVITGGRIN